MGESKFLNEAPEDRRARQWVLAAYIVPVFLVLLPSLWLSVDVTQHTLPTLSPSVVEQAKNCTAQLKRELYSVNVAVALESQEELELFEQSNRQYLAKADCVAGFVAGATDFSDPSEKDDAFEAALDAAGGVRGLFAPACHGAGLTLIVQVVQGGSDAAASIVFGRHAHAWTQVSTVQDGAFPTAAVQSRREAAHRQVRATTKAVGEALLAAQYDVTFFLLNEDPSRRSAAWDFKAMYDGALVNLFDRLAAVADVSVSSELLHFVDLPPSLVVNAGGVAVLAHSAGSDLKNASSTLPGSATLPHRVLPPESLEKFASLYDWDFGASPPMHSAVRRFVVGIAAAEEPYAGISHTDERVTRASSSSFAFSIPRWGGFVLLNRQMVSRMQHGPLTDLESKEVIAALTALLRHSFGLPSLMTEVDSLTGTHLEFVPPTSTGVSEWELNCVHHAGTVRFLSQARRSQKALRDLIENYDQVAVPEQVASDVWDAKEKTDAALAACSSAKGKAMSPRKRRILANLARHAAVAEKAALFHPGLQPVLYFPWEHLAAVYLPVLLPLLLPLALAVRDEIRARRERSRA